MDWLIRGCRPLTGEVVLPGDKSITHRALIVGALAAGRTRISGASFGDDCRSTLACLAALGVSCQCSPDEIVINGAAGALLRNVELYCGNSGTTMRLLAGALAAQGGTFRLDGDESLRRRPMARIAEPLRAMGATITAAPGGKPPLTITGGGLRGVDWQTQVASAQVKSAILLAGLGAAGATTVREPAQSRDHTERMLSAAGAEILRPDCLTTTIIPNGPLHGIDCVVPADFSAAAFWIAAATAIPGSELMLSKVGLNETRTGLLDALESMGASVQTSHRRNAGGEPAGDLTVRHSVLDGCELGGALIPRLIDELPVVAVLATAAHGRTVVRDGGELRVKESDRLAIMAAELRKFGAIIDERPDGWEIDGPVQLRPAVVDSAGDHRVAMALAVAALMADGVSEIRGVECATVSDRYFARNLETLKAISRQSE